jgi:NADH:ubiquinone oxidoreductase subunit 3 (subunit A)
MPMAHQFLPVLITLAAAGAFAVVLIGSAALFGQRTRQPSVAKRESYEAGMPILDSAYKRISVRFYLVALVFVVLDVEVAFLYPWALNYRDLVAGGSLVVFWEMVAFLALLALAYAYLWRRGIFDWGRRKVAPPDERPAR